VSLEAPRPRALARPVFAEVPEPLRAALRVALLCVAAGGWLALGVVAFVIHAAGRTAGVFAGARRRPDVRATTDDVAAVFRDGQTGFGDLARRAVARRR
jgi:hypothetical protein